VRDGRSRRGGGQPDVFAVGLKEHIEALLDQMEQRYQQRFDAQNQALTAALLASDKAVQTAMSAAEKAVAKAEIATDKRFESVNEFRATLSDQTAEFARRLELQALAERVTDLATRMDKTEGKSTGLTAGWGYLVGMIALAGTIIGVILAVTR
jgi:hypothetical protein